MWDIAFDNNLIIECKYIIIYYLLDRPFINGVNFN